jgi:predicted RNA-binding protein
VFLGELGQHLAHQIVHDALVMAEIVEERPKGCVSDLELRGRQLEPVGDVVRPDQMEIVVGHGRYTVTRLSSVSKTWVLTGSLDNFRATRERGFRVIGAKEGRRGMAEQIEPGDRIAFYVTGVQAFGGIVRVTGEMYEDRAKIWPGKPGKVDAYPWRFETEPEIVLDEDEFVPAAELAGELEHVRKWPAEHWHLAFQGQLRTVSDSDAELLEGRIRAGVGAAA